MSIDLILVVAVVAQSVEYLSRSEVREMVGDCFGGNSLPPQLHNSPNGSTSAMNYWFPPENAIVSDDIPMLCRRCHGSRLSIQVIVLYHNLNHERDSVKMTSFHQ